MKGPIAASALTLKSTGALAQDLAAATLDRAAPALGAHATEVLAAGVRQDAALSARDRAFIALAALATGHDTGLLAAEAERSPDAGRTPADLSETITHLAFHAGRGNAMAAADVAAPIFDAHGVALDDLPPVASQRLPLDNEAEAMREPMAQRNLGEVRPGPVEDAGALVFRAPRPKPNLAPRDRSLGTVAALVAAGQPEQMAFHLARAVDNGLARAEAGEVLSHLALCAGRPRVYAALPVAGQVLEARAE